jgi:sec-independent protein translocase protein TatA
MFRNPVTDAIVALVVMLLIFGPKRLPLLGRSLGQGIREFKNSITDRGAEEGAERPALMPPQATASASAPPPVQGSSQQ